MFVCFSPHLCPRLLTHCQSCINHLTCQDVGANAHPLDIIILYFLSNIENCPERFCVQEFLKGKDETLSQQTSPYVMFKWPPSFQMICFTSSEWPLSCILNFGSKRNEIRVQFDRIDMRRLCDFTPPAEGKLTLARDDTESQSKFYLRKVNGKWVNAHGRLIHIDRRCGTLICKCDEVDSISVLRKAFLTLLPASSLHMTAVGE